MAKATKTKKVKEVVEEPEIDISPVPIIEEPEIGDEPPSVTLDEVKAVEEKQTDEILIPVIEKAIEQVAEAKLLSNEELSMEQKIIRFIDSRSAGEIRMNDFLKSLFGVPKFGEPAKWLSQAASKELKVVLNKLSNEGQIAIVSNAHMKLGTFHYPDTSTMKTQYHNLNSVQIIAIKRN